MTNALPNNSFVTLSEALSWMAFGDVRDKQLLNSELAGASFGMDYARAKQCLEEAVSSLTDAASGGSLEMRGKYLTNHDVDPDGVKIEVIPAVELDNQRQFDITIDGLRFGSGLAWLPDEQGECVYTACNHPDFYTEVTVNRRDLMRVFSGGVAGRSAAKRGALVRISEPALQKWWGQLTPEERALPRSAHSEMCKVSHPGNSVARSRIRALTPDRNPGPKPNRP